MRVIGILEKQPILILIDNGSTHNFVSDKLAQQLKLPITSTTNFPVMVADGSQVVCKEQFDNTRLQM